jgi:hypothetical protein
MPLDQALIYSKLRQSVYINPYVLRVLKFGNKFSKLIFARFELEGEIFSLSSGIRYTIRLYELEDSFRDTSWRTYWKQSGKQCKRYEVKGDDTQLDLKSVRIAEKIAFKGGKDIIRRDLGQVSAHISSRRKPIGRSHDIGEGAVSGGYKISRYPGSGGDRIWDSVQREREASLP